MLLDKKLSESVRQKRTIVPKIEWANLFTNQLDYFVYGY